MSYCCYAGDIDPADINEINWRKAAKVHKCCECGIKIEVGEKYEHVKQLYGHRWYEYRTCDKCADLRESLEDVMCVYYEGLADAFTDWLTNGLGTVMRVKEGSHAARLAPSYFIEEVDDDETPAHG